jgi:hypothetical protein
MSLDVYQKGGLAAIALVACLLIVVTGVVMVAIFGPSSQSLLVVTALIGLLGPTLASLAALYVSIQTSNQVASTDQKLEQTKATVDRIANGGNVPPPPPAP